jgi:rhamnose transport system substrate-binding protein
MRRRVPAALALAGLIAVFAAGCKQEKPSPPPPGASPGRPSPATGDAVPAAQKYRVVYIPKNTGNPYFDDIIAGFKQASGELGFEFDTVAPASADAASQIPFIKQQIQRGVNAIAISPNSPDAIKPALKEALAKGIQVVCVDADMPGHEEGRTAAVLPMDFDETGKSQIELMGSLINYKGEIAILSATTDAPNQNYWIKGMQETLKDPKYREMRLVAIVYGNDDPQKSLIEAENLLTRFPNLRGIIAPTTVGVAAAAQAVETAKAADRVQVTGLGTPNQMRRFVQNNTVLKFALWSPKEMGYLSAYLIDGLVKGTIKPAPGVSFTAGSLGARAFRDKNVVITGPPVIFDKSNIDNYNF